MNASNSVPMISLGPEREEMVRKDSRSGILEAALWCCFLVPGAVFQLMKLRAEHEIMDAEEKIAGYAAQIDNFQNQRAVVLSNTAALVRQSVKLDQEVFQSLARYRREHIDEAQRMENAELLEQAGRALNIVVEAYPTLKAHDTIIEAQKQNLMLQREVTSARALYNDAVRRYNTMIFRWPTYQIVACKRGCKKKPFYRAPRENLEKAESVVF